MKIISPLVAVLATAAACLAAPPKLEVPEAVKTEAGAFVVVRAVTPGKTVRWIALDAGLSVLPGDLLADGKAFVAVAPRPGKFRVLAITAVGDELSEPAVCTITVGDGTGPTPPPAPDRDPLAEKFQAAFDADPGLTKRDDVRKLAAEFRKAVTLADGEAVKTNGDFAALVRKNVNAAIDQALVGVRGEIGKALNSVLPTATADMTADLRAKYKAEYAKVAAALEKIK